MKQRLISVFVSIALVVGLCPVPAYAGEAEAPDLTAALTSIQSLIPQTGEIASGECGTCTWAIDSEGTLTIAPANGEQGELSGYPLPWKEHASSIRKATIEGNITVNGWLFEGLSALESADLSGLRLQSGYGLDYMFSGCASLTSVDFSGANITDAVSAWGMFKNCTSLQSVDFSDLRAPKLASVYDMFSLCSSLKSVSFANASLPSVADMSRLLSKSYGGLDSLERVDLSNLEVPSLTDVSSMFCGCSTLAQVDLDGLKAPNLADMSQMFGGCSKLKDIDPADLITSSATKLSWMFGGCSSLENASLSGIEFPNLTSMSGMFYECDNIEVANLSNIKAPKLEDIHSLFNGCEFLENADLSGFVASSATNMSQMFYGCISLRSLNLKGFCAEGATDMSEMFRQCQSLRKLDLSSFDTSNVTDLSSMFYRCNSLTALDLSSFTAENVLHMSSMFTGCESLETIDISNFVAPNLESVAGMFYGCSALQSVDMSRLGTSSAVRSFTYMFSGCKNLKYLDLTRFDTSRALDMYGMFYGCRALKSIRVGNMWSTRKVVNSGSMFSGCYSLAGGMGTPYDNSHVDATYARVDAEDSPGYLTFGGAGTSLAEADVVLMRSTYAYTGSAIEPKPTILLNNQTLLEGYDYTLSYADNSDVGTGTVYVTGTGGYTGSTEKTFSIVAPQAVDPDFKRISYSFANSGADFGYSDSYTIPLESYERVFSKMLAKYYYDMSARSGPWGGNCFGMSASSGMMNTLGSGLDPKSFNSAAKVLYDLGTRDTNDSLGITTTQLIESLQVSQYSTSVQDAYRTNTNLDDLVDSVRKAEESGSPVMICVWGILGGHALLGYKVEQVSAAAAKIYVYDCNCPGDSSRCIMLTADSAGKYVGWSYPGLGYSSATSRSSIAYVPYDTYAQAWRTHNADKSTAYALNVNSTDFEVVNSDGKNVATVADGVLKTSSKGVYQGKFLSLNSDGASDGDNTFLYLSDQDTYRVVNKSKSAKQLQAGIVENEQRASVTTDADEVTFTLSDEEELNLVDVAPAKGETYSITLESALDSSRGQELVELTGIGNGRLLSMGMASGSCVVVNGAYASMYVNGEKVDIGSSIDVSALDISLSESSYTYDGKPHEPGITVKNGGDALVQGRDYVAVYAANTDAGTAKATVYGIGDYSGKAEKAFTIAPANLTGVALASSSAAYDGKAHKPSVTAVEAGPLAVPASSYTVAYLRGGRETGDFTSSGAITVSVTGAGNFAGTQTATFTIGEAPKTAPTITVKKASKTVTAKAAKKKAQSFSIGAKSNSGGKLAYKVVKANAKIKFKNGKVTLRKGSYKKGKAFSVKVLITSRAKGDYAAGSKTVKLKFKIR